jgi:flagellar export protein FliJ
MKRFRFRLESILGLRAVAERAALERFAESRRRLSAAAAELHAAGGRRDALADALAATRAGSFRPSIQTAGSLALLDAERAVSEAARRHAEALAASERAREEWLVARRRLGVIERLGERARRAHRETTEKAEQALLDELASIAAARSLRSA